MPKEECPIKECPAHNDMQNLVEDTKDGLETLNRKVDDLQASFNDVRTFILGDMINDKPGAAQRLRSMERCLGLIIKIGLGASALTGTFVIYIITNRETFSRILKSYLGI